MLRTTAVGLLLMGMAGCMPMGGEVGASSAAFNMVPDVSYMPKEGDRAFLYGMVDGSPIEQIPVLVDVTAYDKYERFSRENEPLELTTMEEQKQLQWSPLGTRLFIVRILDRTHTGARTAAEVRLLDGPLKGRTVFTPLANIAQLMKKVEPQE